MRRRALAPAWPRSLLPVQPRGPGGPPDHIGQARRRRLVRNKLAHWRTSRASAREPSLYRKTQRHREAPHRARTADLPSARARAALLSCRGTRAARAAPAHSSRGTRPRRRCARSRRQRRAVARTRDPSSRTPSSHCRRRAAAAPSDPRLRLVPGATAAPAAGLLSGHRAGDKGSAAASSRRRAAALSNSGAAVSTHDRRHMFRTPCRTSARFVKRGHWLSFRSSAPTVRHRFSRTRPVSMPASRRAARRPSSPLRRRVSEQGQDAA